MGFIWVIADKKTSNIWVNDKRTSITGSYCCIAACWSIFVATSLQIITFLVSKQGVQIRRWVLSNIHEYTDYICVGFVTFTVPSSMLMGFILLLYWLTGWGVCHVHHMFLRSSSSLPSNCGGPSTQNSSLWQMLSAVLCLDRMSLVCLLKVSIESRYMPNSLEFNTVGGMWYRKIIYFDIQTEWQLFCPGCEKCPTIYRPIIVAYDWRTEHLTFI